MTKLFYPVKVVGDARTIDITDEMRYWYPWIDSIRHKSVYLALSLKWRPDGGYPDAPPSGYDYYITSGDSLMFGWPEHIVDKISGQVIHLTGAVMPDSFDTERIRYVPWTSAHQTVMRLARPPINKHIKYKASALTSRISQSKAIVFAALMSMLDDQDRAMSLNHTTVVSYNVHSWQLSGNAVCDRFMNEFRHQHLGKTLSLPWDDGLANSYNNSAYQNTALNFTQESYHHSYMVNGTRSYIEPGPFVTEKTLKCLLSATAFIPVGQAYTYQWLEQLGCRFNYGELDLGFDQDPGNLTRLEKVVDLIESLRQWSAQDLYEMTLDSTLHNHELVTSDRFWQACEQSNADTTQIIQNL